MEKVQLVTTFVLFSSPSC